MANEKITDHLIARLLTEAGIKHTPNGSSLKEVQEALKTASKQGTGKSGFPEFTAQVGDFLLVIENKADEDKQAWYEGEEKKQLSRSTRATVDYAENGALHYAEHIVKTTSFKKIFAFGCTGDNKHHCIRPIFVGENGYQLLDKVENLQNFTESNINNYYRQQILGEASPEVLELEEILKQAKVLHEHLKNYGQLGDTEKPLVVSAILLALSDEENFHIENLKGSEYYSDGDKIYQAISSYMDKIEVTPSTKKERVLAQFNIIKNRTLLNQVNEYLGKTPLRYFTEYLKQNILSSIRANSTEDILGRFYGEFIRYSGGDGQTLGVILTPRHITELFCDLVNIKPDDRVFDPCCGTSGFLIAAMHRMMEQASSSASREHIKKEQIFGVKVRDDMFSIATTNMILRGDGKSNLEDLDFLKTTKKDWRDKKLSVGFINPPYSQAKNKETAHLSEIRFIAHLLDCLADGARCVAIIPQSTMVGKTKEDKKIKAQILEKHTLEGVFTLNKNTFYGIGVNTCIAIFTAHQKHPPTHRVKFINFEDDGYVVSKHVGLVATPRAIEKKQALLDWWFDRQDTESRNLIKTTVEASDEWLHSFYYFNDEIPKEADFDKTISDYLAFEFNMVMQGREYLFGNDDIEQKAKKKLKNTDVAEFKSREWKEFLIGEIFDVSGTVTTHPSKLIKYGDTPRITRASTNNGLDDFYRNPATEKAGVLTVDSTTSGIVTWQGYNFIATDHVEKLSLKKINAISKYLGLFVKSSIDNAVLGKYGYGYGFSQDRIKKQKILLPVNSKSEPDYDYMEAYIQNLENQKLIQYLAFIQKRITDLPPLARIMPTKVPKWMDFYIEDIFIVNSTSSGIDKNKLSGKSGKIPYITRSDVNNGIDGFVSKQEEHALDKGCCITIGLDTQTVFYQESGFYTGQNIQVLENDDVVKTSAIFLVSLLKKQMMKFNWGGNGATLGRLKKTKILLPVNKQDEPDYKYMEQYMQYMEYQKLKKYQTYIQNRVEYH